MSFILDALKKLERQKQKDGGGTAAHETVMEGGRRWGETRRRYAGWGGVVLALVAMVVAVVALYQSRNVDAPPFTEPENVSTTPLTEAAAEGLPPSTSPPPVGPDVSEAGKGDIDRPTAFPNREEAAPEAPEEAELEDAGTIPEEEIESIPPVRLVGSGTGDSTSPEPISEGAEVSDQIPEGLPELVLQGTSVVDGRPIAVINYQRLFEGDMIEGALVVKIADRIVELEYEGKRFVLRL